MPELRHFPRRPRPPGEAERLSRWLREWDLEQRLREEDQAYAETIRPPAIERRSTIRKLADSGLVATFDTEVKVGQIRILHGGMFAEVRRPMHIAIMSEWPPPDAESEDEPTQSSEFSRQIIPLGAERTGLREMSKHTTEGKSYLVAPFGDYHEPATTTEWLTGREERTLRVLCLWNTRDYPERWLELGWEVGELTKQELTDAWEVFRHALTGVPLSDRLRPQVGAPIIHPRDPRLTYQAEETRLFSIVPKYADHRWQIEDAKRIQDSLSRLGDRGGIQVPSQPAREFEQVALAAAPLGTVSHSEFLAIGLNIKVIARFDPVSDPAAPRRWLLVRNREGTDNSIALNGCHVLIRTKANSEWREVSTIEGYKTELPQDAIEFRLIQGDGSEVELKIAT